MGKKVETVTDFIFLDSKITAHSDCSHEIKRCLLLGSKAMTNPDSILKSRHITLPTEICLVKVMVFPVVMCRSENWTVKKAEYQRIDAFELWCLRRLLRVLWTTRRSSQSILKEISPEYSLVRLMLKLKLQYFGHLMQRTDSREKTLMLGKIEGRGGRHPLGWVASLTQWPWVWEAPGVGVGQGSLACCSPWGCKESDMTKQLNWTDVGGNSVTWPHLPAREAGRCSPLVCPATLYLCHSNVPHAKRKRTTAWGARAKNH